MNYKLINSSEKDLDKLIEYKLRSILDYAGDLTEEEKKRINNYVINNVPNDIDNYKNIVVDNNVIGCLLVKPKDDGVLIDEIYLDSEYRGKGIGTDIIRNIIKENKIVYLWVYKENINAVNLYKKLGFSVIEETDSRFYMRSIIK